VAYPFKTQPKIHQFSAWERTNRQRFWAYLFEMGTGKTKTTIDVAAFMYDQGWIDAMLVFGPNGSYLNWKDEFVLHMPTHVKYTLAVWSSSMTKPEARQLDSVNAGRSPGLKILLMNIEALAHERSFKEAFTFASNHKTMGVIDESTTIKNPTANRTKAAWALRDVCAARRILTGSLVDNRPLDAWSQFEFLQKGALGFTSFFAFKAHFANLVRVRVRDNRTDKSQTSEDGRRAVFMVAGFRNLEDLHKRISRFGTIVKKAECIDLPPKTYQKYYVDLTPEQRRMYDSMRKDLLIELGSSIVSVTLALTKILRLHQIVCGFVTDDEGREHSIKSNRLDALMSVIDESSERGIIWANYRTSIKEIYGELSKRYGADKVAHYYGDTSKAERDMVRSSGLRSSAGKIDWLVASQMAGGYGNNWTAFNLVCYYANCFDGELRNQSEARTDRMGQTGAVTYVDFIAKDTVDEKILEVLRNKKSLSDEITKSNWREWL
jgi:SNF2 family DNA or RNA helicase